MKYELSTRKSMLNISIYVVDFVILDIKLCKNGQFCDDLHNFNFWQ